MLIQNQLSGSNEIQQLFTVTSQNFNTNNQILGGTVISQQRQYNTIPSSCIPSNTSEKELIYSQQVQPPSGTFSTNQHIILPDGKIGIIINNDNILQLLNQPNIVMNNGNAQNSQIFEHLRREDREEVTNMNKGLELSAVPQVSSILHPTFPIVNLPRSMPERFPSVTTTSAPASDVLTSQNKIEITNSRKILKCQQMFKAFLSIRKQPNITDSMTNVIQKLIDAQISTKEFLNRLRKLIQIEPKVDLTSFLNRSIPLIRQALISGKVSIPGINPPPTSQNVATTIPSNDRAMYFYPIKQNISNYQHCSTPQALFRPIDSSAVCLSSNFCLETPMSGLVPFEVLSMQQYPRGKQIQPHTLHFVQNYQPKFVLNSNIDRNSTEFAPQV